jgi:hypothetical protein
VSDTTKPRANLTEPDAADEADEADEADKERRTKTRNEIEFGVDNAERTGITFFFPHA